MSLEWGVDEAVGRWADRVLCGTGVCVGPTTGVVLRDPTGPRVCFDDWEILLYNVPALKATRLTDESSTIVGGMDGVTAKAKKLS